MLKFKKIQKQDIKIFKEFFENQPYKLCDFTAGVLYMWADVLNYEYCIYEDTLFIKCSDIDEPDKTAFALPLSRQAFKRLSLEEEIRLLKEYLQSEGNGDAVYFNFVPESEAQAFKDLRADFFEKDLKAEVIELTDWFDYIYDAEKLASLSGHIYNKKRNRVNLFLRQNEERYEARAIRKEDKESIIKFLEKFYKNHFKSGGLVPLENKKTSENCGIKPFESKLDYYAYIDSVKTLEVIDDLEFFDFPGMIITIDGEVKGITLGERIGDTLYIHVEKADAGVDGIYQILNNLFAKAMLEKYGIKYINRGEDMGDEGLRHAKMSYQPIALLKKYKVKI